MPVRARAVAVAALLLGGAVATTVVALAGGNGGQVVARVGQLALTIAEVEQVLGHSRPLELHMLGKTPDSIRKTLVDKMLRARMFALGAKDEKLEEQPDVQGRIRRLLIDKLHQELLQEALASTSVSNEAVKAYYDQHRDEYRSELRIKLWQIVVGSSEAADKLLDIVKNDEAYRKNPIEGWEKLAREHSLDKATYMRKGNLGFVQADGSTANRDVKVDPALFKHALEVKDGEVVPRPIQSGQNWVVLQRRGSHLTPERTLASEAATIRNVLAKRQVRERFDALLAQLRKKYVGETHPELLEQLQISIDGDLGVTPRSGSLKRREAARPSPPSGRPGELR